MQSKLATKKEKKLTFILNNSYPSNFLICNVFNIVKMKLICTYNMKILVPTAVNPSKKILLHKTSNYDAFKNNFNHFVGWRFIGLLSSGKVVVQKGDSKCLEMIYFLHLH